MKHVICKIGLSGAMVMAVAMVVTVPVSWSTADDAIEAETDQDEGATPVPDAENDEARATDSPQRVIVRAGRNVEVKGYIELEDDDVIVVRTRQGRLESFPKQRVQQIVRLVEPKPGQVGLVVLRDGQFREGVIVEDTFDHVLIEVEGIRARLLRESVDRVILQPTFQEQYEQFVSTLEPRMHHRHLVLIRWLMEHRRYDLAHIHLQELMGLLNDSRDLPEAARLLRVVEAQLALQAQSRRPEPAESTNDGEDDVESGEPFPGGLLTREDVNLIRVYEIDFDRPPRVTVEADTIRRLIAAYSTDPLIPTSQTERNKLFRAESIDIVKLMFMLRAREFYPEVQVHTEPHSLNLFRQRVHNNWLLNNCGTCHGGPNESRFTLHRRGYQDERVRFTNLLILERLEVDPQWPLINYNEPEMSLIIQYGLPRDMARLPHPDVKGWRPAFGRGRDRLKDETVRWIRSMMQPRPEYPVEYVPPGATGRDDRSQTDEGSRADGSDANM